MFPGQTWHTCLRALASSDPDVPCPPHRIRLGRPDDSILFLWNKSDEFDPLDSPENTSCYSLSLVYLLSQKTPDACVWAGYLVSQLHAIWQLVRGGCGLLSIPSVSLPFISSWCLGSLSSSEWTASPCLWGLKPPCLSLSSRVLWTSHQTRQFASL